MKYGTTKEEHRLYTRWWREQNPDKVREIHRRFHQKHKEEINRKQRERRHTKEGREKACRYMRLRYAKLRKLVSEQRKELKLKHRLAWNQGIAVTKALWKKAEALAPTLLSAKGYAEVIKIEDNFPFDYLCKKNGQIYAVEVTTDWKREIKPNKLRLLLFTGWICLFLFIRPSLKEYRLVTVTNPTYRWVSAFSQADLGIQQIPQQYIEESV
jgi:hypothetical protein